MSTSKQLAAIKMMAMFGYYNASAVGYEKLDISSLESEVQLINQKKSKLSANDRRNAIIALKRLKGDE